MKKANMLVSFNLSRSDVELLVKLLDPDHLAKKMVLNRGTTYLFLLLNFTTCLFIYSHILHQFYRLC